MKIAVNTRLLIKNKLDGIGLFTLETFKKIVVAHPEVEFVFIFDRTPHPDFIFAKNIIVKVISPQARHPFLYVIWYQFSLKRLLKKLKADVFVATDGMIPLHSKTKTLSVIHDLNFEHYPEHIPALFRNYYCKYFSKFAHESTRIATVSNFSKQDICSTYKIDERKIDVVYNGPNKNFVSVSTKEKISVQKKYTAGYDYFLFVGTIQPRKNLINLFKAFDDFKIKTKSTFKLLVVGHRMWWRKEIDGVFNQLNCKDDIIFAGRVDANALYKITASAYALTYVSIFEGFGIPLVEAMSCGTPVITSNCTAMPEVIEDAGILVDPFSVEEISNSMIRMTDENGLQQALFEKSLHQSKKFSWDKTADLLWDAIQKTIQT